MDRKRSTANALNKFLSKQIAKPGRKRHNSKPEKEVERACLAWMRSKGWAVEIYEAKATFNPKAGKWIGSTMKAGTVDCQGLMSDGTFVAVEFKAPARIATFNAEKNHRQKEYLVEKIRMNAFGCVVDSARRLQDIFDGYADALLVSKDQAQMYLMGELP